jgi:hypothetical protein
MTIVIFFLGGWELPVLNYFVLTNYSLF